MKKLIIILAVVLLAQACKMGKNYKGTELEVIDNYHYKDTTVELVVDTVNTDTLVADSLFDIDFFSLFNDPNLDTLVRTALEYNQDVLIAGENVLQAQYQIGIQRADLLPGIGYQAGVQRGNVFQGIPGSATTNVFTGFGTVSWELDIWGKIRRLTESAKADYIGSIENYRGAKISLASTVAEAYFALLENHARLEISYQTLALRDSMLNIINERFEKGYIAEIDVSQARIQRAIAAGSIPEIERRIALNEHLLSVLTGQLPSQIRSYSDLYKQDTVIVIPAGLPSDLLTRRPDIIAAEQNLIAQNALVGAAQANRFPSLSLTGLLGVASTELSEFTSGPAAWNISGSLLGPIFNWNKLKRQVDVEKSRREQAIYNYERTVLTAFREVEDALASIELLRKELRARQEHVDAAIRAQTLSQERYSQGVTSYLEYLESQRQAFEAQQNYAGTKGLLLSTYAQLYKALGGNWKFD
jgi:multidrug efflux system outer membrane protein